jgi:hypothetical protein
MSRLFTASSRFVREPITTSSHNSHLASARISVISIEVNWIGLFGRHIGNAKSRRVERFPSDIGRQIGVFRDELDERRRARAIYEPCGWLLPVASKASTMPYGT